MQGYGNKEAKKKKQIKILKKIAGISEEVFRSLSIFPVLL